MDRSELFEKQGMIGAKIERILGERGITKTEICLETGVSKPTFDKLLKGNLTNEINYIKHISKIMQYLEIDESDLFGGEGQAINQIRTFRNLEKMSQDDMANRIGVSLERYKNIEEGEKASLAELRDIAMILSTSVHDLLGKSYFISQIASRYYFVDENSQCDRWTSGFWGHLGIMRVNSEECLWYPITLKVREAIYKKINNDWMVVPCLNNKLLVIKMDNIKELLFVDEACDMPADANWNGVLDSGEIPLVFYETFWDYCYGDRNNDEMSEKFIKCMAGILSEVGVDEESFANEIAAAKIYYSDGNVKNVDIDFRYDSDLVFAITEIYENSGNAYLDKFITYDVLEETERLLNTQNVSLLELPLMDVEDAIGRMYEELGVSDNV